jgi:hypothetical protein
MLSFVIHTITTVVSMSIGLGFFIKVNFPFSIYEELYYI